MVRPPLEIPVIGLRQRIVALVFLMVAGCGGNGGQLVADRGFHSAIAISDGYPVWIRDTDFSGAPGESSHDRHARRDAARSPRFPVVARRCRPCASGERRPRLFHHRDERHVPSP